jgi:hypothetical protein
LLGFGVGGSIPDGGYLLAPRRRIYLLPAVRSSDPDKSPPCSQTNTSSQLSPTRSSGVGGAATRAAGVGSRPTRLARWRSKDEPTAAASAIRLTDSTLPAGVSVAGQARRPAITLRSRRATSPLSAVSGVPQPPQKRLSCGFSCRHLGQKARWVKIASFPLHLATAFCTRLRLVHLHRVTITAVLVARCLPPPGKGCLSIWDRG